MSNTAQAGDAAAAAARSSATSPSSPGSATAIRNGVSIILNKGDNVEKGDVVQSGSDSTLGITFIDGTVFGLSSNARMVLNEMVYDPNGSNNSSLISLVAGTISFVAGETAKHGDMKIDTPVATMGIRGTAVLVEIDFTVPGQDGAPDAKFQVLVEPDGTTGSYILFDKTTLQPIAIVNQAGQQININNGIISISQCAAVAGDAEADHRRLHAEIHRRHQHQDRSTRSTDIDHSATDARSDHQDGQRHRPLRRYSWSRQSAGGTPPSTDSRTRPSTRRWHMSLRPPTVSRLRRFDYRSISDYDRQDRDARCRVRQDQLCRHQRRRPADGHRGSSITFTYQDAQGS